MRVAVLLGAWTALGIAQNAVFNANPFVGTFQGDGVTLEMAQGGGSYSGTLALEGRRFLATMKAAGTVASGSYDVNGEAHRFTLTVDADGLRLTSAGGAYRLARKAPAGAAEQAAALAPEGQAAGSIVGGWRNATSSAQFNADGTGVVNGRPGRYEIRGNQLTLTGAQGQATLPFELHGDVLALTVNGAAVTLNRVKEEAGEGEVQVALVGKWCWISVTAANQTANPAANQGARQSSRCMTLNGNGTYALAGETGSRNPNGGTSALPADSGTWTATDTTLTAHSRSGKATTYRLEKRNHAGKVRDPMIVLDGQTYVTFYNKPPW
jgi:hypothetical protein